MEEPFRISARTSCSLIELASSLSTAPGEIVVVRMSYGFTSWRSPSDNARTANFVAQYTVSFGSHVSPATEATLMTFPLFCLCIWGSAAAMPYRTPLMLRNSRDVALRR